jgi:hypothetical protein
MGYQRRAVMMSQYGKRKAQAPPMDKLINAEPYWMMSSLFPEWEGNSF